MENIIASEKLLDYIGITPKIFIDYVMNSKLVPAFFTLGDCYITFWNAIILGLMSDSPFLLDSVNYDGAKQTIELF